MEAPSRHGRLRGLAAALVLALAVLAGACEEAVNPFLEGDRFYTIYGYLDTDRDTQYVRVEPLRRTVELSEPGPLTGVSVTMTEEGSGRVIVWQDSLLRFDNGTTGHVYRTVFRPQHGRRYRLSVRDGVGGETYADTRVPPRREVSAGAIGTQFGFSGFELPVSFRSVARRPLAVEVWYRMQFNEGEAFRDVPITYGPGRQGGLQGDAWRVTVELSRDADTLHKRLSIPRTALLPKLYGVGVRIAERDSAWVPPGDLFDPITLIEPGTFTNVVGGFGFFGSIGRQEAEWVLPDPVTRALGFAVPQR